MNMTSPALGSWDMISVNENNDIIVLLTTSESYGGPSVRYRSSEQIEMLASKQSYFNLVTDSQRHT